MDSLIVSPLLQVICDKLASPILKKAQTSHNFKKEMKKLQERLLVIQAVMEDAEERQLKDQKIKIWLTKLRDVAYDADDLFDELTTLVQREQRWLMYTVCSTFLPFKILSELKEIRERLDDIAEEMSSFQFKEVVLHRGSDAKESRETGPYVEESQVYGRKEDIEEIVEMLLSSNNNVWVVPIVGIGGIGKTTLTRLAYNDERITRHFDLKMWVSVYDNFNTRKLINEIQKHATKQRFEASQMGGLQCQWQELLCEKRYLLVLDGEWSHDQDEWDKMKSLLRGSDADGSKIIVTTRSEKVASIMGSTPPYLLEALSKDDCWNLFKQRAFKEGEEDDFPNLLPIGEQIVDKCKGVPLAAKILGSLMRFKREEREWVRVQGSELWNLDGAENRILSVLRLSFNHLPSHLKGCFAYCAVFPRNYDINKKKLIQQWIAEGLIQISTDGYPKLEDIGNEHFNDLRRMSFFQGVGTCDDSDTMDFRMHDLIYDLAKSVAGNECLTIVNSNIQTSLMQNRRRSVVCAALAKTRHASVECKSWSDSIPDALFEARRLHTLDLLSSVYVFQKAQRNIFSSFRHLKNLNFSGCGIKPLHRSIGDLIYLRFLDLSNTPIETLPESIRHLCNLHTLNLSGCYALLELPKGTTKLISLVHLNIKDCASLTRLPARIGNLKNLQTLPVFCVCHTHTVEDGLSQLRELKDLRGELAIKHLENLNLINDYIYPEPDWIKSLRLHSLGLSWGRDTSGQTVFPRWMDLDTPNNHSVAEVVIRCLKPNHDIRRLFINEYPGTVFPRWMDLDTLSNLTHLELINCRRCENLPTLGQLPVLKVLNIQGMDSVVNIGSEFFGEGRSLFPSLNELCLRDFPKFKAWESMDSTEAFSCLNRLAIIKCPCLITIPWFPSLQHLEMQDCNPMILRSAAEIRSLSTLVIVSFPELTFIPKVLVENNSPLRSLMVLSCPNLSSMPPNLQRLLALRSLTISSCPELASLPEGLQHVKTLQNLGIHGCPKLIELPEWVMYLVSLRSLKISDCKNIKCLPQGLEQLSGLQHLSIKYCPDLEERCQKSRGDDWQKISHIPNIYVGSLALQQRHATAASCSRS